MSISLHLTQPMIGRRREARLRLQLPARLTTLDGVTSVVLIDLASGGARVDAACCRIRAGQDAVLSWDRFEAFGSAMWNDGRFIGLLFEQPLAAAAIVAARALEDARRLPVDQQAARDAAQAFVNPRYRI